MKARSALEVGFAYGFSTVWILDALSFEAGGRHIAIDPFQESDWDGVGLEQVRRLGSSTAFRWEPDFSIHVLTRMIRGGDRFDFAFIDGNHRFDDVVVDFYLTDQVLKVGGCVAFDDLWMPSIRTATDFIKKNRSYSIVSDSTRMLVLKKVSDDDRNWDHFRAFSVDPRSIRAQVKSAVVRIAQSTGMWGLLVKAHQKFRR